MIKGVSALKTVPANMKKIAKRVSDTTTRLMKDYDDIMKEQMSYIRFADESEKFDPFISDHFDYLKYIGVRD